MFTLIGPRQSIRRYRQLACEQNLRRFPRFHVEITFADVSFNLRKEHHRLKLNYRKETKTIFAQDYD